MAENAGREDLGTRSTKRREAAGGGGRQRQWELDAPKPQLAARWEPESAGGRRAASGGGTDAGATEGDRGGAEGVGGKGRPR